MPSAQTLRSLAYPAIHPLAPAPRQAGRQAEKAIKAPNRIEQSFPPSTFDLSLPDGSSIPIEQRPGEEIANGFGKRTAPAGITVFNPAFYVTPASLITGIVTEHGIIQPVTTAGIPAILKR